MEILKIETESARARSPRFVGFDVVRAGAAFGVVLLHCCVPYMQPAVPGLAWSVHDTPHWLAEQCFWTIELFIMPVFLVLAGFLAWQTLQRGGAGRLIKTRARRLLVPLAFGMVCILPLDLYAWLLGWVADGLIPPQKLRSLKFDPAIDRDLWGLSHLWFLQYVFLYAVTLAVGYSLWKRHSKRLSAGLLRLLLDGKLAALGLVVVGCLVLKDHPEVVWGFQHDFFPVPSKWIYSGVFFALGALIAACDGELDWLKAHSSRLVGPAVITAIAALTLGNWHLRGGSNQVASIVLAVTTFGSAMMITLAIIGESARRIHQVPVSIRYLAAASFWIYIFHHPFLGLVHVDLKWLLPGVNPIFKIGIAFVLTSALSVASYEMVVRKTTLGRLLGFQWSPPVESDNTDQNGRSDFDTEKMKSIPIRHASKAERGPQREPGRRAA